MNLIIPRDRNGSFHQQTVPAYKQTADSLEATIVQFYQKGITTREIVDLLEKMYGHHYSPVTISNMAKLVAEDVKGFHTRSVKEDYVVIYADATYIPVRRDRVCKEALHVLIGIDPDGKKEVLDYALFPEESCRHYQEMIRDLKQRGLKRVLLFVSDGLTGLADALNDVFPRSKHHSCWTHLIRQAVSKVAPKTKS